MRAERTGYIISDIHIGGAFNSDLSEDYRDPIARGFRIFTHGKDLKEFITALSSKDPETQKIELIINGDFLDFLAELHTSRNEWVPFCDEPSDAVAIFRTMVDREKEVFSGLARFLHRGHTLVLLLGNHDVEASLPAVRREIEAVLEVNEGQRNYRFLYDGEAYRIGNALVEHGNRYDRWNQVNHNRLRVIRALQSRGQKSDIRFTAPPGSRLVSRILNPLKQYYRFIDLLKPESEAILLLILAFEPKSAEYVEEFLNLSVRTLRMGPREPAVPRREEEIGTDSSYSKRKATLQDILESILFDKVKAKEFLEKLYEIAPPDKRILDDEISYGPIDAILRFQTLCSASVAALIKRGRDDEARRLLRQRLPVLCKALRQIKSIESAFAKKDSCFEAAEFLSTDDIRCVVMGHTHVRKRETIGANGLYLNSGTWTDCFKIPPEITANLENPDAPDIEDFFFSLASGQLAKWLFFEPSYVRLHFTAEGNVDTAECCSYERGQPIP